MKTLSSLTCIALLLASASTYAEPSSNHASKASKHSALAVSHGVAGSAQVASAAVAVPLIVGGGVVLSAGLASAAAVDELSDVSSRKVSRVKHVELEVTEVTITVDAPPAQAIKRKQ